jgi:hypothetical protein
MRTRSLVAVAAITPLLLSAGTAHAAKKPPAKKPVCNLMTDPAGDGTGVANAVTGPNDTNLDLVGADVASNTKVLTTIIKINAFNASGDTSPYGRAYDFSFKANGQTYQVRTIVGPTETTWANGVGTGFIDTAKKEIHASIELAKLTPPLKPGSVLTELQAMATRWIARANIPVGRVDAAASPKTYTLGWPSCVKVGA